MMSLTCFSHKGGFHSSALVIHLDSTRMRIETGILLARIRRGVASSRHAAGGNGEWKWQMLWKMLWET